MYHFSTQTKNNVNQGAANNVKCDHACDPPKSPCCSQGRRLKILRNPSIYWLHALCGSVMNTSDILPLSLLLVLFCAFPLKGITSLLSPVAMVFIQLTPSPVNSNGQIHKWYRWRNRLTLERLLAEIPLGPNHIQDRNNLCAFKIGKSDAILLSLSKGWMWYKDHGGKMGKVCATQVA